MHCLRLCVSLVGTALRIKHSKSLSGEEGVRMGSPAICMRSTPVLYASNRSGRPICHARGEMMAAAAGKGALGNRFGNTSSSGGLQSENTLKSKVTSVTYKQHGLATI